MYFINLNKAYPKEIFPLPHIKQLVDITVGHDALSFMDAYSWFNQIWMYGLDEEKNVSWLIKDCFATRYSFQPK